MKKYITYLFILLSITGYTQTWSGCGQGFFYPPTALFADTISNKLYVSGFATSVYGINANNIASWDGTKWDTLGHGVLGTNAGFLIRYKNKLYLQKGYNIYTWDFNTLIWDSVPGGKISGDVWDAEIDNNNNLILVGQFNKMGSVPAHNIVRFDGTTFTPIGYPTFTGYIRTVAIYQNEIYIGGNFNDTLHGGIAKWNGTQWIDLDEGFKGGGPPEVADLKVYNNRLYAGGAWYGTKNEYNPSLAAWDGIKWNNIGGIYNNTFPWGVVYTMFEFNHKLHVFGGFNRAGNIPVDNVAIWNDTIWCGMNSSFQGEIGLVTSFQNHIYVGGHYKINNDSIRLLGYNLDSNYMINCGVPIGVNDFEKKSIIKIFPNPTNSLLSIVDETNGLQNATLKITNYLGQVVYISTFVSQINVSDFSAGMYFLIIEDREIKRTIKFIKQ